MPTQKQILASIDDRLGVILAAMQKPAPPQTPAPEPSPAPLPPPPAPPVVTLPPTPGPVLWTRSRIAPVPTVTRTPAQLIAARLVPPYYKSEFIAPFDGPFVFVWGKWPGANYMGATGERWDLGLVNAAAAEWLIGRASDAAMLAWGEGHGEVPVHFRLNDAGQPDPNGTHPVDVFKYPDASCYPDSRVGNPRFPISGDITPEAAHYPSAAYLPYLATGDLFYLQEVQDAATFMIISPPPGWNRPPGGVPEAQVRAYAWGLNLVAQAFLATQEAEKNGPVQSPLMPSAYWKRVLDVNRARFKELCILNVKNDPMVALGFMQPERGYGIAVWMHDYLGAALGWMIWTGQFPEWQENYNWCMKQLLLRTSGKSGYPRTRAVQYSVEAKDVNDLPGLIATNPDLLTEMPNGRLNVMDRSYGAYLHANLKMAVLNKMPGMDECFAWLDPQIEWIPAKWAV